MKQFITAIIFFVVPGASFACWNDAECPNDKVCKCPSSSPTGNCTSEGKCVSDGRYYRDLFGNDVPYPVQLLTISAWPYGNGQKDDGQKGG